MFIYSHALCSYDSLIVYPAYMAVPSQMLSAVFSSSYILLPLLSLSCIPSPWLHPLATATAPCCSDFMSSCLVCCWIKVQVTPWLSRSLFLIHEYEITHAKCINRVLPFSGELYILCSCMSLWPVTNSNHEHSSRRRTGGGIAAWYHHFSLFSWLLDNVTELSYTYQLFYLFTFTALPNCINR